MIDLINWFKKIKKKVGKAPKEFYKGIDPKGNGIQPEYNEENHMLCPNCKHSEWIDGPEGGASINIKCNNCGWWYNYMGPFGLDFLRESDDSK